MEQNELTTRRLRGSASIAPDGSFDFRPQRTADERRTLVRKSSNGSALYRTAVNDRLSVSLTAPAGHPDPEAWMAREMNELLSAQGSKAKVKERGCVLAETQRTKITLDTPAGVLRATITLPLLGLDVVPHMASQTAILLSHVSAQREVIGLAADAAARKRRLEAEKHRKEAKND